MAQRARVPPVCARIVSTLVTVVTSAIYVFYVSDPHCKNLIFIISAVKTHYILGVPVLTASSARMELKDARNCVRRERKLRNARLVSQTVHKNTKS